MPSQATKGVYDTSIAAWLKAMQSAKKLKPGGKLVFVNKRTGTPLPTGE